jgi:hypothetical protein
VRTVRRLADSGALKPIRFSPQQRVDLVALALPAIAPLRPLDLVDAFAAVGEEAGEAHAVAAAPLDRPQAVAGRVFEGKGERAVVAAPIGADLRLEHDGVCRSGDESERVGVAVGVDADDVVQLICEHAIYLQPPGWGRSGGRSGVETARGRTVTGHAGDGG